MKVSWDKKTVVELAELLEDIISRVELLEGKYVAQVESGSALKPQPVATLCGAVDKLLSTVWMQSQSPGRVTLQNIVDEVRRALAAERKRAELVDEVIESARCVSERHGNPEHSACGCSLCRCLRRLDAHDKGAENG